MLHKELVIIGRGPAGLTAGLYAARASMDVLLIGGWLPICQVVTTNFIENYPGFPDGIGGPELIEKMEKQAVRCGLEIMEDTVSSITRIGTTFQLVTGKEETIEAASLVVATGAMPRQLGVEGETALRGKGVCYCATCDGPLFRGSVLAVVGGGEAALKESVYLTRFASKVYLIHRGDTFSAEPTTTEAAVKNPKIEFILGSVVKEINGEDLVTGITVRNVTSGEEKWLPVEGVFLYIGIQPNSGIVSQLVELDELGFIVTGREMATSMPGIFAAGDVCAKSLRQITTAVADGSIAVRSVEEYLKRSGYTPRRTEDGEQKTEDGGLKPMLR